MDYKTIILAAGGTGGHIFPAIAVAEELQNRGHKVLLFTDDRGKKYSSSNIFTDVNIIKSATLGGGLVKKLRAVYFLLLGYLQARKLLSKIKPDIVVGFGGYPSFPTMFAAVHKNIKTAIHEQNSLLGRANKILSHNVDLIATSFDDVKGISAKNVDKVNFVGNPVRADIADLYHKEYPVIKDGDDINILITGGSQGASIFADIVPNAIINLPAKIRERITINQQSRSIEINDVRKFYKENNIDANIEPFFDNIPELLSKANLVISRAGASTLAELTIAGRPAILVPYPHAMDDHQTVNAQSIVDKKAGWIMQQNDFTIDNLTKKLDEILTNHDILSSSAQNMKSCAANQAASNFVCLIEGTLKDNEI